MLKKRRGWPCGAASPCRSRNCPWAKDHSKQDPDSYCTSRQKFDELKEEDFITWFARYTFMDVETTEERGEAMNKVCDLLTLVDDEVKEGMYVKELSTQGYADKAAWTSALKKVEEAGQGEAGHQREQEDRPGPVPEVRVLRRVQLLLRPGG